jgi:hypothetical protein
VSVRRAGRRLVVRYSSRRGLSLLLSAAPPSAPDQAVARRVRARRSGVLRLTVPNGPLVVQASAFDRRGVRSRVAQVRID